jgi:hypothetical protein
MANARHLEAFLESMGRRDVDGALVHLADKVARSCQSIHTGE